MSRADAFALCVWLLLLAEQLPPAVAVFILARAWDVPAARLARDGKGLAGQALDYLAYMRPYPSEQLRPPLPAWLA